MTSTAVPTVAEDRAPVDSQTFRDAMSRYGTSVHVVTTDGPGGRCGLTATAVVSLSDRPPTVLVCINHGSRVNAAVKANGNLCINTLDGDGAPLSDAFAGRGGLCDDDRFRLADWTTLQTGAPVLRAARVAVDARVDRIIESDTHSVIFARVVDVAFGDAEATALLHLDRRYRSL